ncbi:bifunctional ADP-dependent NAD(P)H-hydrate dehydratase/NAD(P)H-hydrate epimerase [Ferrimonas senticii]|uniref:bifunctional ADP-dependent NAD(P)H-hydrate dehydratase/NAD(P)H-hydrate epimerase n=1 Tax=Ferrimonas senticii TaxID=394566 RepID=UPI0004177677|nr:bifunctional ADP-dependent NAD(P)H-hydrate dehydratase/NAD(P)H-hydrate epimerase [Ferrimonas senticii]
MRADLLALPSSVNLASTIRQQEPLLAKQLGISLYQVMEQAGNAAYQLLRQRWPEAKRICVLCGAGNNAGDGYVLAREAAAAGLQVRLLQTDKPLDGDALIAQQSWLASGGTIEPLTLPLPDTEILVDALLGTGISGTVRPALAAVITAVNQHPASVLAVDLPSGVNAQTGGIAGVAVNADITISFVANKLGLLTGGGLSQCGELHLAPLQLGAHLAAEGRLLQPECLSNWPARAANSHKGSHGKLLLLGGAEGMAGALRLAAEAALRSGAGLVAAGCAESSVSALVIPRPEVMAFTADSSQLEARLQWCQVIGIGPGLGQGRWSQRVWQSALAQDKPMLVDADGLTLLAAKPQRRDNWVLTPHPGEAARLLDCSIAAVEQDRLAAAQAIQRQYGGVVVLKGVGTVIVDPQQWSLAVTGNCGLATGGSGDLLSGIIAGLMAQGHANYQAACMGVMLHGEAADRAAGDGLRGMLPSDLFPHIRFLANQGTL